METKDMEIKDWASERDEVVLAESLKNPSLFGILVDRYEEAFLRKAGSIVKKTEEAEDVVQETFVKIYRFGASFRKKPNIEFKSWAYKILVNTSLTHYTKVKKSSSELRYLDYLDPNKNDTNEEIVQNNPDPGLKHDVQSALAKIPSMFAEPLKAYFFEGKSYKQIAKDANISLSALKMRLFRAKKMLKKIF